MSSAGQHFVVHDSALPGLGLLLSDDPLREWLAERGEVLDRRCYLRYKPGTSCVAALRLASGPAFMVAVSAAAQPKLHKLIAKARAGDVVAHDPQRSVLLASLTVDRDLPALFDLEYAVGHLLEDPRPLSMQTLVYKPQRRWVGLVRTSQQDRVVLRAYRRSRVADAAARLRLAQHAAGAIRVPRLLAKSRRSALLAVTYLTGTSLDAVPGGDAGRRDAGRGDVAAAGEALAKIHSCDPSGLPPTLVSKPTGTAAQIGSLAPQLANRVADLVARLAGTEPPEDSATLCHGDFSLDQVVVDEHETLGVIDWDRAGRGNPAADLASAIAAGLDDIAAPELLAGYNRLRPIPPDLSWHLARARLQRLAEPFRLASPTWPSELERGVTLLESAMP